MTSRLVFLDVTVLDKNGCPVVSGLTKDDFVITEHGEKQEIVSFEPPDIHVLNRNEAGENSDGKAPLTIFVLDLLNSKFEDFAYIRYEVKQFLNREPARLSSPAELLVLGNRSLEILQNYTTRKLDLLDVLAHLSAAIPYKRMSLGFFPKRFAQSIDTLQQIAVQNMGVPGRKNTIWVGHGGPNLITDTLSGSDVEQLREYVHDTTNMLVDARISLFVIYPGLSIAVTPFSVGAMSADADIGETDPFAGDINFGVFVNETGGRLFFNRNDVDNEIKQSEEWGSNHYTLTYHPPDDPADGKFQRIRVTLRSRGLKAITKAGYFDPASVDDIDLNRHVLMNVQEALQSTIPLNSLDVKINDIVKYPDSGRLEITALLEPRNLPWQAAERGNSSFDVVFAAASLSSSRDILASKIESAKISVMTQDPSVLAQTVTPIKLRVRIPPKTRAVRLVVQAANQGRLGSLEIDATALRAARVSPTPDKLLLRRSLPQ